MPQENDNYVAWMRYAKNGAGETYIKVTDSASSGAFKVYRHPSWVEQVEEIRKQHNGVFSVELFFGHDGHNACKFRNYEIMLASGDSGRSMQEAVDRCIAAWRLREDIVEMEERGR